VEVIHTCSLHCSCMQLNKFNKLERFVFFCKATVEPMQIDTGPEDSDANRVMVENTALVNMKAFHCFCYFW